ncbi:MAG: DNA internalization-related competence protein ComEC/Rec2 [Desulfovibrionaceae bacterium]
MLLLGYASGLLASLWLIPALVCLAVLIALDARSGRPNAFWCLLLIVFVSGLAYATLQLPSDPEPLPQGITSQDRVEMQGVVKDISGKPGGRLQVVLEDVQVLVPGKQSIPLHSGVVWSWHDPSRTLRPGQDVHLLTRLLPVAGFGNPGAWDYGQYWRMQGVGFSAYSKGEKSLRTGPVPESFAAELLANLQGAVLDGAAPGQGRALLLALLTGDRFELDTRTVDLLRRAGLSHTLALSGLHLGFVASLGLFLALMLGRFFPSALLRVPRPKLAVLLAAPAILGYVWLGQASPSLVRAALMFVFWGLLLLTGRPRVLLDGLFLALACMLLVSPLSVFDLRLQLSVVAVAGIAVFLPALQFLFRTGDSLPYRFLRWFLGIMAVSFCANVALLPLTARYFGMFTPNLLPNFIWLPPLGFLVLPLGGAGMLLGVFPWTAGLGQLLVAGAINVLDVMLTFLQWANSLDFFPLHQLLRPLWPEMLGCAVLLVLVAMTLRRPPRCFWPGMALGLALLFVPQLQMLWRDAQNEVRVEVLDVGQGQAIVISLPGGGRLLLDGGGLRSRSLEAGRDVVAPYLTLGRPPRLDWIVLSHPHMDHYKGLFHILEYFEVGRFAFNGLWPSGDTGRAFRNLLEEKRLSAQRLARGDVLSLGHDASIDVLHPFQVKKAPTTNDTSLVLLLKRAGRPLALLPGDAEAWGLKQVLASAPEVHADLLVLPHHGSRTGLLPVFYDRVAPFVVFCSCGRYDAAILPDPDIRNLLEKKGLSIMTTADDGLLQAVWDREGLRIGVQDDF